MVLDKQEDHFSNQDQDFEDDKETLRDVDNETYNDSEMMVSFSSMYCFYIKIEYLAKVISQSAHGSG